MLDEFVLQTVFLVDFGFDEFDQFFTPSVCDLKRFELLDKLFEKHFLHLLGGRRCFEFRKGFL
jgi:hypothetical protein